MRYPNSEGIAEANESSLYLGRAQPDPKFGSLRQSKTPLERTAARQSEPQGTERADDTRSWPTTTPTLFAADHPRSRNAWKETSCFEERLPRIHHQSDEETGSNRQCQTYAAADQAQRYFDAQTEAGRGWIDEADDEATANSRLRSLKGSYPNR